MLIISIPKSASTSLLKTISSIHQIEGLQLMFKDYIIPMRFQKLGKYHSDLRDFTTEDIITFSNNKKIYKQHIPPTDNNLELLKNKKKVILLREPRDIILAYYRAEKKLLHEKRPEFKNARTQEAWIQTAEKIGLLKELKNYYEIWNKIDDEKLIIKYEDLIADPQKTINKIEIYFELSNTKKNNTCEKKIFER